MKPVVSGRRSLLRAVALATAALLAPVAPAAVGFSKSKAEERAELLAKLQRDLMKVGRSITVTENLIAHSRTAPYLPDLFFRLAELYVEKSRYRYHLEAERRVEGAKSSLVAPEVRLLKEKAISIYDRITREFLDYKDDDKVRFFLAHEYRELGKYEDMIKAHEANIEKHPKSGLAAEGMLIIGDYWFDKSDLDKAEKMYLQILERPSSPVHDLARYKMGWVWINRGKHAEAVKYFEAAAGSKAAEGAAGKTVTVKALALSDLVYSYTEAKPAKGAIRYFEDLSDNSVQFQTVLEKLGNRYYIKQEFENAAPAYRRLLTFSRDAERDPDRVQRLYETIVASKGKVFPRADDAKAAVRVAARARVDLRMKPDERARTIEDFEIYSRYFATALQQAAQRKDEEAEKKEDKKLAGEVVRLSNEAAEAYDTYLSLFQVPKYRIDMERNRAEALFAAKRHAESGRGFEEVAKKVKGPAQEEAIYKAVAAFSEALKENEKLSYFDRVDSRGGIKQMGSFYVRNYAKNEHVPEVKLRVARAYYEEGEFKHSGELFAAFACEHPGHKDMGDAVNLAMDSYLQLKDFKNMDVAGKKLLGCVTPQLQADIREILKKAKAQEMSEVIITGDEGTSEAGERLRRFAEERKGTDVAQEALRTAFQGYYDRREMTKANEMAQQILKEYPKSQIAAYVIVTLAQGAYEACDFEQAAALYESMSDRFPGDSKSLDALNQAALFRLIMGDPRRAAQTLERAASEKKRADILAKLAEARALAGDVSGAAQAAEQALRADASQGLAAGILGKILLDQNNLPEAEQQLTAAAKAMQKAVSSDPEELAKVYFMLGEALYRRAREAQSMAPDKKVEVLSGAQQAYSGALQMGGEWAVAGLFRLGQVLGALADAVQSIPEPPGLSEAQKRAFRSEIEKNVGPLKANAEEAFAACLRKANEFEVYTPFARACRTRKEPTDGLELKRAPAGQFDPVKVAAFREALVKNSRDGMALEGMARVLMESGAFGRARLVLTRLIEVDENRPWAHAAMGLVLARSGELELAKGAYKKALEIDGSFEKAVVGLAAMKCRAGDTDGAKKDLVKLKKVPVGPDVEDLGAACGR